MSTDWLKIEIAVFSALGLLIAVLIAVGMIKRLRYRVGSRHVKVLLFGVCLRRVSLANIESVSKRRAEGWAEHWWSTLRPKHRMLVIRRKRGLFKNFVITPKNRYVFRTDIERAMRRAGISLNESPAAAIESETSSSDNGETKPGDPHAEKSPSD